MKKEIKEKRESVAENMVEKEVNKMKRKKVGHQLDWKAEWIKEWGEVMAINLAVLFSRIEEKGEVCFVYPVTSFRFSRLKMGCQNATKNAANLFVNNLQKFQKSTVSSISRSFGDIKEEV